jgi:hypothetical protein
MPSVVDRNVVMRRIPVLFFRVKLQCRINTERRSQMVNGIEVVVADIISSSQHLSD